MDIIFSSAASSHCADLRFRTLVRIRAMVSLHPLDIFTPIEQESWLEENCEQKCNVALAEYLTGNFANALSIFEVPENTGRQEMAVRLFKTRWIHLPKQKREDCDGIRPYASM